MKIQVDIRKLIGSVFILLSMIFLYNIFFIRYDTISKDEAPFGVQNQIQLRRLSHGNTQTKSELNGIMAILSGPQTQWDDPKLVNTITTFMIDTPRPFMTKFSHPLFKTPQADTVDKILNKKKNGFFVECGGLDGERSSNTIWLEQKRHWNGLIVEMDPSYYMQIRGKNRKCYSINACISPYSYPMTMNFKEHNMGEGKLVKGSADETSENNIIKTHCFPFYSIMLALNRTNIDYLSLDVEGLELEILRSIPFDLLDISILTVEFVHGKEGKKAYEDFMHSKQYKTHSVIKASKPEIYFGANDLVFVKEDFKP